MRRLAALAVLSACPAFAAAQTPAVSPSPTPTLSPTAFQMPGKTVGSYQLQSVGTAVPKVATPAGSPVAGKAALPDVSTQIPGMKFDPKNVVGPVPAGMRLPSEPSAWDRFVREFGESLGLIPPPSKAPPWTPGLSRRNRERAEERAMQQWRRD